MLHDLETIYRKLRMNAKIIDGEAMILIRDFDKRLQELEQGATDARLEATPPTRQRSSKVSKKKIPTT